MIHEFKYFVILVITGGLLSFISCDDEENEFSQPVIDCLIDKVSVEVGNEMIEIGPRKEFEQDSEVIYKLYNPQNHPYKFSKRSGSVFL